MKYLIEWLIVFILIYLLYLFFVILRKKKVAKIKESVYLKYLIRVYKLNEKKINNKKIAQLISFVNSFIIATTFIIIVNIENILIMMLLAIIVIIPFQLIMYHIIGKILKKGEC